MGGHIEPRAVYCAKKPEFAQSCGSLSCSGNLAALTLKGHVFAVNGTVYHADWPESFPQPPTDQDVVPFEAYSPVLATIHSGDSPITDMAVRHQVNDTVVAVVTDNGHVYQYVIPTEAEPFLAFAAAPPLPVAHHGSLLVTFVEEYQDTLAVCSSTGKTVSILHRGEVVQSMPVIRAPLGVTSIGKLILIVCSHGVEVYELDGQRLYCKARIDCGRRRMLSISRRHSPSGRFTVGSADREVITVDPGKGTVAERWKKALKYEPRFLLDSVTEGLVVAIGMDNGVLVGDRSRGVGGARHGQGFIADSRFVGADTRDGRFVGLTVSGHVYFSQHIERFSVGH